MNKGKLWGKIGGTPTFDKDAKRWMMSLVGLFLPAKRAYGRNGAHAMERRRRQIARGVLRVTA